MTHKKVTRPQVQQFHSAVIDSKAKEGFFVTINDFTGKAYSYMLDKPIHLINGNQLLNMIEKFTKHTFEKYKGIKS
ncbi:restriction endonuclease [Tuberibacillus sp. Marseille-P3662]|uniref:restriction endonuclease n=1 Tax=Tuberibacillus sp. Marseille-P3662 TaxID=1965358 RepID=UPI000A1C7CAE